MNNRAKSLQHRQLALSVMIGAACHATVGHAAAPDQLRAALQDTKPILELRMRVEAVDQEPFVEESEVTTLRARLGFETGKVSGTSLLLEAEGVWPVAGDYRPDNAVPTHLAHPVVADPEGYEINRLQLTNTRLPDTAVVLGRQRIMLDDQRFVGNVGWRQNEQTFDGLRVINKSVPKLSIDVSYLNQVNRIFGPESPQGRFEGDMYVGNLAYQLPVGKLSGFAYLLDFDPIAFTGLTAAQAAGVDPVRMASATYGLRFAGERAINKTFKFNYALSYAQQDDYGRNPLGFSLDYRLLEVSATYKQYTLGLGQELLEGNGVMGFNTPLATLHKFQGTADRFLTTPVNGIDDRYVNLGYQAKSVGMFDTLAVAVSYHLYENERVSTDLGDEVNLQLQAKWQRFNFMLKYSTYTAEQAETPVMFRDTDKYWAQVEFSW
jgi:hypothetical protein